MLPELTIQKYLHELIKSGRTNGTSPIEPTQDEIILIAKLSKNSSFFEKLMDDLIKAPQLTPRAFVYVLDAKIEEEKKALIKAQSNLKIDLPDVGENIVLTITIAVIKEVPWTDLNEKIRMNLGYIGYAGQTEVFFWGSNKVLQSNIEEGQQYQIKGLVKNVIKEEDKIELKNITEVYQV